MVIVPISIISFFYSTKMSAENAQDKKVAGIDSKTFQVRKTVKICSFEVKISSKDSAKFHNLVPKLLKEI